MITVGITGGIGSGKSVVCSIFKQLGIAVYNADDEAKKMYDNPSVIQEIKKIFGETVFTADGMLDRKKMAKNIFSNEEALKAVNEIIHPLVNAHFATWKKEHAGSAYILKEAAILFESGTNKDCDKVILVTAPAELRIKRIVERDKRTREEVKQIISRQWSEEEKMKRSDFAITNDETTLVIPQVLKIHNQLTELSKGR